MNASDLALALAAAAALGLLAAFAWALTARAKALAELAEARAHLRAVEDSRETVSELLKAQAAQSAQAIADQMVRRAAETFQNQDRFARERLEAQLKPVAETLTKFQQQVAAMEQARAADTGGLKAEIAALMTASGAARDEARRLTETLKGNTGRRGRWGEQTCRNVLEAAGMAGRFDFIEQRSEADDEGRQKRPDFLVRLPGEGVFVIDAKAPLAFPDPGVEDEAAQAEALSIKNAAALKAHVRALAAKGYQDQFQPSPDFVALFVPGDAFLASALDHEPELMNQAMESRVVIVTPTTLFALCKAVAYGWRAEEQSRNADQVVGLGRELYKRLSVMGDHVAGVGKALNAAVGKYNQFVGSLESQVMVQARRFEDLKVDHEGRSLEEPPLVEAAPRALNRPELLAGGDKDA